MVETAHAKLLPTETVLARLPIHAEGGAHPLPPQSSSKRYRWLWTQRTLCCMAVSGSAGASGATGMDKSSDPLLRAGDMESNVARSCMIGSNRVQRTACCVVSTHVRSLLADTCSREPPASHTEAKAVARTGTPDPVVVVP